MREVIEGEKMRKRGKRQRKDRGGRKGGKNVRLKSRRVKGRRERKKNN